MINKIVYCTHIQETKKIGVFLAHTRACIQNNKVTQHRKRVEKLCSKMAQKVVHYADMQVVASEMGTYPEQEESSIKESLLSSLLRRYNPQTLQLSVNCHKRKGEAKRMLSVEVFTHYLSPIVPIYAERYYIIYNTPTESGMKNPLHFKFRLHCTLETMSRKKNP